MNTSVLKKCIEELGKEKPDLSYIRGMLETLVELSANNLVNVPPYTLKPMVLRDPQVLTDEEQNPTLNAYLGGNTGAVT